MASMASRPTRRNSPSAMSPGLTNCSSEIIQTSFPSPRMMRPTALARHGSFVPVRVHCRAFPGTNVPGREGVTFDEEADAANPVLAHAGRRPAGLGRGGCGSRARQSRELADPPRIRMGEPGLATLDSLLQRTVPLPALRRARVRDDRLEGRRPLLRALGR